MLVMSMLTLLRMYQTLEGAQCGRVWVHREDLSGMLRLAFSMLLHIIFYAYHVTGQD